MLEKFSNWTTICISLVLYVIFAAFILPLSMETGLPNMGPLDLLFSYSPDVAYLHLESFGVEGRERYAKVSMLVDTIYPVIYTLLFLTLIYQLQKNTGLASSRYRHITFVPLFAFAFDILENTCIVFMLKSYPERHDQVATLSSLFTSLKWISVGMSSALLIVLVIIKVKHKLKR
jgi:hypothetical protein